MKSKGDPVMAIRTKKRIAPGSYMELVQRFPLTSIRDDDHLDEAIEMIDALLRLPRDEGQDDYLDALSDLVEHYESAHADFAETTPAGMLRFLMDSNGLTQQALAGEVGISQTTISHLLNEVRPMNLTHIGKLATRFGVSPAVFLPR